MRKFMKLNCEEFVKMYHAGDSKKKVLLDIREPSECASGMLKDAINIPMSEFESRFSEIAKDKEIFIYCRSGARAERAETFLIHKGYKLTRFLQPGGYDQLKNMF